jgi:hypothetical protein
VVEILATASLPRFVNCKGTELQLLVAYRNGFQNWSIASQLAARKRITWTLALGATLKSYRNRILAQLSNRMAPTILTMMASTFRQPTTLSANL